MVTYIVAILSLYVILYFIRGTFIFDVRYTIYDNRDILYRYHEAHTEMSTLYIGVVTGKVIVFLNT